MLRRRFLYGTVTQQTPADITGGKLWWDFANTDSYTITSGKVSDIHDLFGVSPDFSQATDSNRGTINGSDKLVMSGGQFYFPSVLEAFNFLHNGSNFTIVIIAKSNATETATTDSDYWFASNRASWSNVGFSLNTSSNSTKVQSAEVLISRGTAGVPVLYSFQEFSNVFRSSSETMTLINFDYSVSAGQDAMEFKNTSESPELLGSSVLDNKNAVISNPDTSMQFGRFLGATVGFFLKAEIGAILMYDKVLDSSEEDIIKAYYGI